MKLIKIFLSTLLLFIFVTIVGVALLMWFMDPNKLKPVIAELIKRETGFQAVVEGQFTWSFYPRVGVKVERMALIAPTQTEPFVDLHDVIFVTELGQLIRGDQKLRGDIYIAETKLANTHIQHAHVGLRWHDKMLTLFPLTASLYDGVVDGIAHGSQLTAMSQWDWNVSLKNVQLKPLLQDLNGNSAKLSVGGVGQLKFQGTTQGNRKDQILNYMNGNVEFTIGNGVFEGIDANYLLETADAVIYKQPLKAPTNLFQTTFESVMGNATIKNGVAEMSNVVLTSPTFVTTLSGNINLPYQTLNLEVMISPQKQSQHRWMIPANITGNVTEPDVRLDMTELNIILARAQLEKVRSRLREEVQNHVSGRAGAFLQGLIGQ